MSGESQSKKQKKNHNFKRNFINNQQSNRKFLEPGQRGFLATCNFREKACVRECYNVLNHFADELYGSIGGNNLNEQQKEDKVNLGSNEIDDKDITDDLEKEIQNTKSDNKNKYRFQVVDTGTMNCLFIKTTLTDPIELGLTIVKDIQDTKKQRSRHLLRLIPISTVTRANLKDIVDAAALLFDEHFLKTPKTFSVIFNKRYNNSVKRDEIIKELAELVVQKNIKNKVDLKNPEVSIVVEIIKGLCCLGIVPHYLKYKKYNLVELAGKDLKDSDESKPEVSDLLKADASECKSVEGDVENTEIIKVTGPNESETENVISED